MRFFLAYRSVKGLLIPDDFYYNILGYKILGCDKYVYSGIVKSDYKVYVSGALGKGNVYLIFCLDICGKSGEVILLNKEHGNLYLVRGVGLGGGIVGVEILGAEFYVEASGGVNGGNVLGLECGGRTVYGELGIICIIFNGGDSAELIEIEPKSVEAECLSENGLFLSYLVSDHFAVSGIVYLADVVV